jgi:hypothetical protein
MKKKTWKYSIGKKINKIDFNLAKSIIIQTSDLFSDIMKTPYQAN